MSVIIVCYLDVCVLLLQDATHKVENYVFHMFRHYNFGRMTKSADFFLLMSNSQYVTWWSAALSLLIVTSGYLQLLFLKRLFTTSSGGEDEKPRCWSTEVSSGCLETEQTETNTDYTNQLWWLFSLCYCVCVLAFLNSIKKRFNAFRWSCEQFVIVKVKRKMTEITSILTSCVVGYIHISGFFFFYKSQIWSFCVAGSPSCSAVNTDTPAQIYLKCEAARLQQ